MGNEYTTEPQSYTEVSVPCAVCGVQLKDWEVRFLARDVDFLSHGDHLVRIGRGSA